ncbi:hypothetical protein ABZ801_00955 [Actinomadura sp. NPDC047616]|uniref:hypothetical protein n=1 Tax=Actinomadura sp. NPDC047616 TaxID=3155914 RepID=UPI0033DA22A4
MDVFRNTENLLARAEEFRDLTRALGDPESPQASIMPELAAERAAHLVYKEIKRHYAAIRTIMASMPIPQ